MKFTLCATMLFWGLVPSVCDRSAAAEKIPQVAPLPVEDVLRIVSPMYPMAFSPDRKWLAYAVQNRGAKQAMNDDEYLRTGVPGWAFGSDICVADIRTLETKNLTSSIGGSNWLPVWSPDGRYLAFLSDAEHADQAGLWIWDTRTSLLTKASDEIVRAEQIEWTPDGKRVLTTTVPRDLTLAQYLGALRLTDDWQNTRNASETTESTAMTFASGESASPNTDAPFPKGKLLGSSFRDLSLIDPVTRDVSTVIHGQRIGVFRVSRDGVHVAYSSPLLIETGSQRVFYNLAVVSLKSKQRLQIASDIWLDLAGWFSISPDGSQLSYRARGSEGNAQDIYVASVNGGEPRNLTHFDGALPKGSRQAHTLQSHDSLIPVWDPSGKNIYYLMGGALWRVSVKGGNTERVAGIEGHEIRQLICQPGSVLWTRSVDKETIVVAHDNSGKQDGFFNVDLAGGQSRKLLERGECYTCGLSKEGEFVAVAKDSDSLLYVAQDARHAADIWLSDASFLTPRRLTDLNPQLEKYKMGSAQLTEWLSDDGERLQGTLLLPSDYQTGKCYPLVVLVYPPALLSDKFSQFGGWYGLFNMQLFATRGYAVLLPDAPLHLNTSTRMLDLAKMVLPAVNKVIEMGVADPERLGIMGHSYGGYAVLSLIVQTNRFKAAIEADGMGDLIGFYGEMANDGTALGQSIEHSIHSLGGTLWEHRERYIENSPIFYLDRVKTPLLIIHGAADTNVAPFLGDQIFVGSRRLGHEVEYAKYSGEGHDISSVANQVDVGSRIVNWFDRYLKQDAHPVAMQNKNSVTVPSDK